MVIYLQQQITTSSRHGMCWTGDQVWCADYGIHNPINISGSSVSKSRCRFVDLRSQRQFGEVTAISLSLFPSQSYLRFFSSLPKIKIKTSFAPFYFFLSFINMVKIFHPNFFLDHLVTNILKKYVYNWSVGFDIISK